MSIIRCDNCDQQLDSDFVEFEFFKDKEVCDNCFNKDAFRESLKAHFESELARRWAKEMNSEEISLAIKKTQQHLIFLKSVLEAQTDLKLDVIVKESTSS